MDTNIINSLFREDGYINATQLCKAGNKKFNDWYRLITTTELINILSSNTGISKSNLVHIKRGGKHYGSWIHPDLAVQLAQWISPTFALEVSSWISEWRKISEINNNRFLESLNNIEDESSKNNKEKIIQSRLSEELNGISEVETEYGFIDIVTSTEIIEIKKASNYKSALGQILSYAEDPRFINHIKRIHLFDIDDNIQIDIISKLYNKYNIILTIE